MSYDVTITANPHADCQAPHAPGAWFNMTSNVSPVWRAAGCDVADLHGTTTEHALPLLRAAIERIEADPGSFAPHVRGDGTWGNVDTAVRFLRDIADACEHAPNGTMEVSW